ncbi:unnamed protein product, partial [Amoebophrya sp. A25]
KDVVGRRISFSDEEAIVCKKASSRITGRNEGLDNYNECPRLRLGIDDQAVAFDEDSPRIPGKTFTFGTTGVVQALLSPSRHLTRSRTVGGASVRPRAPPPPKASSVRPIRHATWDQKKSARVVRLGNSTGSLCKGGVFQRSGSQQFSDSD